MWYKKVMTKVTAQLKQLFPNHLHERIFWVGGSVRDHLLGRQAKDIDLAAALSDGELSQLGFIKVTSKSTVPIWFRYDSVAGTIEVIQIKNSAGLNDDLLRRDFSINAMAMSLSGQLIDPLGGSIDLCNKILRPCAANSFTTDPLRIFRAFRFEADGWKMSAETEELIRDTDWHLQLRNIPVERFSREMLKALACRTPELFFQRMYEFKTGLEFLPELYQMPAIPAGPIHYHPEGDLFTHSIEVLQRTTSQTNDPLTRFCSFFHDIGKLATPAKLYPSHHGHDQAGYKLAICLCDRLKLPTSYKTALAWISRLHTTINLWDQLRDSTKLRLAEQTLKAGISEVLPIVSYADKAGGFKRKEWDNTLRIAAMTTTELGICMEQLAGVKESKRKNFILQKRIEISKIKK